ncbi:glutamate decarboxylase [Methyloceanibacter sp.]|uniref:glutamate decarboxylase n=1 Tax=Methyloceanibacter sp. TaxID=1965321 RepID=UPI002088AAA6|nr:glutamate decarboxylase [Methyloceanibacter sp.]GFO80824.1 MAG: glutamate decarboxylase [Methyloceanibacter sp.]HML91807.1 glutamate decarboxylase [Methyloceanibacter sp.]
MVTKLKNLQDLDEQKTFLTPVYAREQMEHSVSKFELAEQELRPETAHDLIRDELMLDGNARLNLATFVTTWMDPEAEKLMAETFDKNMIDKDEYPFTAKIEERCVNIISRLFHAPDTGVGASAIGSSEAVMLAGMALKWRWRARQKAGGKPAGKPNIVMGSNVQVVWEKFARYWEVEPRYIDMAPDQYTITPEGVLGAVDENTIGVVAILGVTYTGGFEPIKDVHDALVKHNADAGYDIPMHVDAASGGFVAPFLQPDLEWDFRLPLVKSINVSGHKYGLVYPGVGWVVWRSEEDLPEDLIFRVNYLGGDMPTFTLNFSRPGNQIVGQYYNFLRLGRRGYTRIMQGLQDTALYLSGHIEKMGKFKLISRGDTIPVFAFALKDSSRYSVFDLSDKLREYGWQVPAYSMPPKVEELAVLRIVVREGFSRDLADMLLDHLKKAVAYFESEAGHKAEAPRPQFSH